MKASSTRCSRSPSRRCSTRSGRARRPPASAICSPDSVALSGQLSLARAPLVLLCALLSAAIFASCGVLFCSLGFWLRKTHMLSRQLFEATVAAWVFERGLRRYASGSRFMPAT